MSPAGTRPPSLGGSTEAAGGVDPTTAMAHTRSSSRRTTPKTSGTDVDDAGSSVSETTAVEAGRRADLGTRTQIRARDIEDKLSRFSSDSAKRITVSARNFLMSRVFELVSLCSDLRADGATERGGALALQGQLIEVRREIAGLQRQVMVGDVLAGTAAFATAGSTDHPVPSLDVPLGAPPAFHAPAGGLSYAAVLRPGPLAGAQPSGRPGVPAVAAGPGVATTMGPRHDHASPL
ncbi:hypothetical protein HPB52_016029 [Rhipicephalus sanguineus]|uniref:Uncharacterized protein n=1 Tax=Rhipicephalus sanguineus TaxID=34632 RepID=A0A9D4T0P1_RHISA|nr:hypothetical protein HPB52_016029 [Rhipicephalus sanguineus]